MNKLYQHRYLIRQNIMFLVGVCLCFYFTYHMIHGERSVVRLISLSQSIETMSQKNDVIGDRRMALEEKVQMMRPGSINKDLLEEQVRLTLGYKHESELVVMSN
ncbi:MAG: septum formation initiator family protein [Pseudomonadota bacterium]